MSANALVCLFVLVLGFMGPSTKAQASDWFALDKSNLCQLHLDSSRVSAVFHALQNLSEPHPQVQEAFEAVLALRGNDREALVSLTLALENVNVRESMEPQIRRALVKRLMAGLQTLPPTPPAVALAFSQGLTDAVTTEILKRVRDKMTLRNYLMQLMDAALKHPQANADTFTRVRFLLERMQSNGMIHLGFHVHFLKLSLGIIESRRALNDFNLNAESAFVKGALEQLRESAVRSRVTFEPLVPIYEALHPVLAVSPYATINDVNEALQVAFEQSLTLPFNPYLLTLQDALKNESISSAALSELRKSLDWALQNQKMSAQEAIPLIRDAMARLRRLIGRGDGNASHEATEFQRLNIRLGLPVPSDAPTAQGHMQDMPVAVRNTTSQFVDLQLFLDRIQAGKVPVTKEKLKELLFNCINSTNPTEPLLSEVRKTIQWAAFSSIFTQDETLELYRICATVLASLNGDPENGQVYTSELDLVQHEINSLVPPAKKK